MSNTAMIIIHIRHITVVPGQPQVGCYSYTRQGHLPGDLPYWPGDLETNAKNGRVGRREKS